MFNRIFIIALSINCIYALNLAIHDNDNPSASHILDAEVIDNTLIVSGYIGGIEFYNISNPEQLNHLTSLNLSGNGGGGGGGGGTKPNCVRASGNYAYFTTSNGLAIVNISNPSNPQSLGFVSNTGNYNLENLDIHNNILAVAAHEDGILVYNISNQANPQLISNISSNNAWVVHLTDNYMYVGDESTLLVYDTNQFNLISSIELSNSIKDIKSNLNYLYIALGSTGVAAFDLDDNLTMLDNYNTSALANRLDILEGGEIAISDWDDVEVLELTNNQLSLVGYKNNTKRTMAIATKGDYIYSAEWNSIQVFEYGEIEGPDIDLNMYELNYPYVESGESFSLMLDVTNNGNEVLVINEAYTTNNEFSPSLLGNLNPGETQSVEMMYTANSANASGSYRIFSNDSDESQIVCETNGNINGANIGDQAPDFNLQIVANGSGTFRLSDYLGQIVVLAFFSPM